MTEFLQRIKLIDYLTTELEMSKNDFVSTFKKHVDEGGVGLFSNVFDVFSSSENEYKGHVGLDGFTIKRRRRLFDINMNLAIANGTYTQMNEKLIIKTEVNGFSGIMIPFYIFTIFFYIVFIGAFLSVDHIEGNMSSFVIPFIILHAALMLGGPYFIMRRSINRMKHELEREFYYMTKK